MRDSSGTTVTVNLRPSISSLLSSVTVPPEAGFSTSFIDPTSCNARMRLSPALRATSIAADNSP